MNTLIAKQRGFSLIELMVTVAVGGIVMTVVAGSFVSQQTVYLRQQQYSEAQQNARAALSIMQQLVREAGFGYASGVTAGAPAMGSCVSGTSDLCNNVEADGGSDKLLALSIEPKNFVLRAPAAVVGGSFKVGAGYPLIPIANATTKPFVISGPCTTLSGEVIQTADIVRATSVDGTKETEKTYTFDPADIQACENGSYNGNHNLGLPKQSEFYIDRVTDPASPRLMYTDGEDAHVLAHDIDDLQIQYGVESLDPVPETRLKWCNDLNNCPETLLADTRANQARVVAVHIALVARTRQPLQGYTSQALQIYDHEIAGGDSYRRWIYRTTIALRNLQVEAPEL